MRVLYKTGEVEAHSFISLLILVQGHEIVCLSPSQITHCAVYERAYVWCVT